MSTRGWWIALVFVGVLACRPAAAGELSEDEPPCAPLTKQHWYGWQTLATDGAGLALIIAGAGAQYQGPVAATAGGVGLGSLFLGGPIVHMAHGRWGIGVLDLGMRLTLPIVGGAFAGSLDCTGECGGPMLAGLMIGLAPIWLDAALLAREDVPIESARHERRLRVPRSLARLGVTEIDPTTRPTRRGLVLGLGGSF